MAKIFASTSQEISEREKRNMERARNIASQGMVLLENNGVLPFSTDIRQIALFGNGARDTVKGGTGSGFMLRLDNFFGELKMSFDGDTWRVTTADQEQWVADMMARLLGESAGT